MQVLLVLEMILPCLSVPTAAEWGSLQGEQLTLQFWQLLSCKSSIPVQIADTAHHK